MYDKETEPYCKRTGLRCELRAFEDTYISKFPPSGEHRRGASRPPPRTPKPGTRRNFVGVSAVSRRDFYAARA